MDNKVYEALKASGAALASLNDDDVVQAFKLLQKYYPQEPIRMLWLRAGGDFLDDVCFGAYHEMQIESGSDRCFVCGDVI